jgi:hypothetical protein
LGIVVLGVVVLGVVVLGVVVLGVVVLGIVEFGTGCSEMSYGGGGWFFCKIISAVTYTK